MDIGELLNEMRNEEEAGSRSNLLLALSQGRRAMQVKKERPQTWKTDLFENVGGRKSLWHQRVAIARDFGEFLLPEIPAEHINTLPSSLALLTQLTKGTDERCRQAHLEAIAGLSYADVKKYVQEIKGKTPCDCVRFIRQEIEVCEDCGKRRAKEKGGDT